MSDTSLKTAQKGWPFDLLAIALASVVAILADLNPSGIPWADFGWSIALATLVALAARRVPAGVSVAIACLGAVTIHSTGLLAAAALAAIAMFLVRRHGFTSPPDEQSTGGLLIAALSAPAAMAVLTDLSSFGRPALSALIAGSVAALMIGAVLVTLPATRRLAVLTVPFVAVLGLLGVLVVGFSLIEVRSDLTAAKARVGAVQAAVRSGDFATARTAAAEADGYLDSATTQLSSTPLRLARVTPVLGPNIQALRDTALPSARLAERTDALLNSAEEPRRLFASGGVALDETVSVAKALDDVLDDATALREELQKPDGVWLLPEVRQGRHDLRSDLSSLDELADAEPLAALLSELLGAETARSYLVLFANPAEARDLGGFTGSTAVLRVEGGQLSLSAAARNGILNQQATHPGVLTTDLPSRYLEQRPWEFAQNYTGSPDLPTIARAMADIFPEVGGETIDGVIYVDPFALDALVGLTGPIDVPGLDQEFGVGDLARFLTRTQYATDFETRGEREQLFADLAVATFDALSSGQIDPSPDAVNRVLTTLRQGRLAFAPLDPQERAVIDALGFSGAITPLRDGADYLSVSHLNAAPNKLDTYMHRRVGYDVAVDEGSIDATVTVTVSNNAPAGLSDYAASNTHGHANGTNRMTLVVHTPHELVSWGGADDEPELTRSFFEFDRWRHERIVIVPQGESRTVTLSLSGELSIGSVDAELDSEYELDIDAQPLVHADEIDIVVTDGATTSSASLTLRNDTTVRPSQT